MKPTKNNYFCRDSGRSKMLFKTEKNAKNFIKFNKAEIQEENGYSPVRVYYCMFCNGWHTSSNPKEIGQSKNEFLYEKYRIKNGPSIKYSNKGRAELLIEERLENLTRHLNNLPLEEIKTYLEENIKQLNTKIDELLKVGKRANETQLKDLRYDLQVLYKIRKQKGLKN